MNSVINFKEDDFHVRLFEDRTWKVYSGILEDTHHQPLQFLAHREPSDSVSLIVFLTERCNLRCSYCKYDDMIRNPSVQPTDAVAITRQIESFARTKGKVLVFFFGGEPMLEYRKIADICSALEHLDNVSYAITTNGTVLNAEALEILKRYRLSVGVSIDGESELHDVNRIYADDRSSLGKIRSNYHRMKQAGVECGPVAVITDPSKIRPMFDYFYREFGDRTVHFKPLDVTGKEDVATISKYFEDLLEGQLSLLRWMMRHFEETGEKLKEIHLDSILHNVLLSGENLGESCHTGPHCGMGETLHSISVSGELSPCHDLTRFDAFGEEDLASIKSRNRYCEQCSFAPLCPSFCAAQFDREYLDAFISQGDTTYADVICRYNKGLITEVFRMLVKDKSSLLGYVLA